jgi:NAD dependent epimerase/dehydratase family enzyme
VAVPSSALRLVLGSEMATELVLGGQRVVPAVLSARGFAFTETDLGKAVRSVLAPGE